MSEYTLTANATAQLETNQTKIDRNLEKQETKK